ncbi:MAG: hypothetical protein ACFFDW_00955 [Candidatus Thorarchaeota archaeon]
MTTIVEVPLRLNENTKKVMDSREEFYSEIKESQFITYTREYFTDCFVDTPKLLKAVNVRLYVIHPDQRPRVNHYAFTWEDISQRDEENWLEFRQRVDSLLKKFLLDLQNNSNAIEGKLF